MAGCDCKEHLLEHHLFIFLSHSSSSVSALSMTRRRSKSYRTVLRGCGSRSESLRVRAGSGRGGKALGRRCPEAVGVKGLGAWQGRRGTGPAASLRPRASCVRASLRPRASSVRARASGRGWTARACPERPSGSRRRLGVSPGAAWALPVASPHPRAVFRACPVSAPAGPRVKARAAQWPGAEETRGRDHVPKRRVLPLRMHGFFSFSDSGAAPSRTAGGPRKLPVSAPPARRFCDSPVQTHNQPAPSATGVKTNTDLFPEVRPSFEEKREALIRLNMTGCLRNLGNHLILKSLN